MADAFSLFTCTGLIPWHTQGVVASGVWPRGGVARGGVLKGRVARMFERMISGTWRVRRAAVMSAVVGAAMVVGVAVPAMAQPIVVFGDSLSDTGNILAFSSSPEAGVLGFTPRPTTPWYRPGQFTNGAGSAGLSSTQYTQGNWVNVLADRLGQARPAAAGLEPDVAPTGTNYAWGGALASDNSLLPSAGLQVSFYINGRAPGTLPSASLYTFWLGGNDLINAASAPGATPATIAAAGAGAMAAMRASIQTLITAIDPGPTRQANILWANLPSLDRTPAGLALPANLRAALAHACSDFAAAQVQAAAELRAIGAGAGGVNPNVNLVTFDVWSIFNQVLDAPASFGLVDTSTPILINTAFTQPGPFVPALNVPSAANPDQYVFWDDLHPTSRMHSLLGEAAAAVIPAPSAAGMMVCGLVVVARCRRPESGRRDSNPRRSAWKADALPLSYARV